MYINKAKKKDKKINKILLLIITIILFLLIAEAISRLVLDPPQTIELVEFEQYKPNKSLINRELIEVYKGTHQELYNYPGTRARLKPNIKGIIRDHSVSHRNIEINTNSLGYRNYELGDKRGGEFRILVLGDSITLADYVQDNETYVRQLENILSKKIKNKDIKAINAGVGSINLADEFAILLETGRSVKPDIVLIGLYLNDAREGIAFKTKSLGIISKSWFLSWAIKTIERRYNVNLIKVNTIKSVDKEELQEFEKKNIHEDGITWRKSEKRFNQMIIDDWIDWGYSWSPGAWERIKEIMEEFKKIEKEDKFTTIVVLLPVKYQVENEYLKNDPQKYFNKTMEELEIPHFDLLPELREAYWDSNETLYYDHAHYNIKGNIVVADIIAEFLEDYLK